MLLPPSFLGILTLIVLLPCFDCKLCNENPPTSYLCTFQNGSKIDLTSLGLKDKPGFSFKEDSSTIYTYNPRYNFTIDRVCKDAAACQSVSNADTVSNYLLATQEVDSWSECTSSSKEKATCIKFKEAKTTEVRKTILELICDLEGGDNNEFKFEKEDPKLTYHMSLKSKYACPITSGFRFVHTPV
ncbi:uncharacterized protein LOC117109128 isoform X2 [Anneissia japonica]|uniref:uncharacterized protein LOC117109128 isoform X2 n=1 Tax=Anneissia japonica TaxID=1529436 RepID=UPI001425BAEA|nr:uncharacterized protein LOC117109128 isoform X2 [Anneissia japonica]